MENISIVDLYWRKKRIAQIKEDVPFLKTPTRDQIVQVTHGTSGYDQFVFWISSSGDQVIEALGGHIKSPPYGDVGVLKSPTHKGWLRGRVARLPDGQQLIVIYLDPEAFLSNTYKLYQLQRGIGQFPIPIDDTAVVVDSSGDILGTIMDIRTAQKKKKDKKKS